MNHRRQFKHDLVK